MILVEIDTMLLNKVGDPKLKERHISLETHFTKDVVQLRYVQGQMCILISIEHCSNAMLLVFKVY